MLYPHNKKTYDEIVNLLGNDTHDILYVQGTGVGKSYVFFELCQSVLHDKKIMYVIPKHAVRENLINYDEFKQLSVNITFTTYDTFNSDISGKLDNIDTIVFDEAHHMASPKRSKNILKAKDKILEKGGIILGMTATPLRSSDRINVCTMFSETVFGNTIFDCINQKLMPPIEYYIGMKLKQSSRRTDFTAAKETIRASVSKFDCKKWLIFFDSIQQLEAHEDFIQELFPDYKLMVVHSKMKGIKNTLHTIEQTDKVVVLTINQLLEGIHVPNIEGILLLRTVKSATVFQQMVGRIMSIGSKTSPVFLDCTGSAFRLMSELLSYNYARTYESLSPDELNVNVLNELTVMRKYPKRHKTVKMHLSNLRKYDATALFEKMACKYVQYEGVYYTSLTACCEALDVSISKVKYQMARGLTTEEAITLVIKKTRFVYEDVTYPNLESCLAHFGITYQQYLNLKNSKLSQAKTVDMLRLEQTRHINIKGVEYASDIDYLLAHNCNLEDYFIMLK